MTVTNLVPVPDDSDGWQYQTNTYVHLEPGLNYRNAQGEWVAAKEEFELLPQGAVARQGQHQVTLPPNLNGNQPVQLVQPDGQVLTSRPHGLAYYDAATGEAVLLAEIKDCQGFQTAPNQILYTDAFDDIQADVRYTYTKGGFEQDVVLKQAPPAPEKYGLNPATTRLEVWSEFLSAPIPTRQVNLLNAGPVAGGQDQSFTDDQLDFGAMKMGAGRAFQAGARDESSVPVGKSWIQDQGRTFLIEAVELPAVEPDLQLLPQTPGGASVKHKPGKRETAFRQLKAPSKAAKREQAAIRPATKELLAALIGPALVLDYFTLTAGTLSANYSFNSDTTYFINGAVTTPTTSTTTFEGGTVIKYASGIGTGQPNAVINLQGPVNFKTTPYRPVVFTSKDDNSAGQAISGSSGTPAASSYLAALNLDTSVLHAPFSVANVRVAFAQTGVTVNQQTGHVLKHVQFVNCGTAVSLSSAGVRLLNALVWNESASAGTAVVLAGSGTTSADVEHVTVDGANWFNNNALPVSTVTVTNSLQVGVANPWPIPGGNPTKVFNVVAGGLSPFNVVTSGSSTLAGHYLAWGSAYRDLGTTTIDPVLAAELAQLTTYAPRTLASPSALPMEPTVRRDNDQPDIGYHYAPLDYLCSNLSIAANTVFTNGACIGLYGTSGFNVQDSYTLSIYGKPDAMARVVWYPSVMEGRSTTAPAGLVQVPSSPVYGVGFSFRFVEAAMLGRKQAFYYGNNYANQVGNLTLRDCQMAGLDLSVTTVYVNAPGYAFNLQNNLFERCTVSLPKSAVTVYPNNYDSYVVYKLYNNLFYGSQLTLTYDASLNSGGPNPSCYVRDNLFDTSTNALSGTLQANVLRGTNAYFNTASTTLNAANDIPLTALSYDDGPYGSRYIASASSASVTGTALANAGSRTVGAAGLWSGTIAPNQAFDRGASPGNPALNVSVGFHYVATAGSYLASDGFSGTAQVEGALWTYRYGNLQADPGPFPYFTLMPSYSSSMWGGVPGGDIYCVVWNNGQAPGYAHDSIRTFTAPAAGWVQVTGNAVELQTCGGDGIRLRVLQNSTPATVWTAIPPQGGATMNTGRRWLNSGDRIFFQVNMNANNSCDNTGWNPRISYLAPMDTDGDGLPDYLEDANGDGAYPASTDISNWQQADTDGDGLNDLQELLQGRNPQVQEVRLNLFSPNY